ncbi:MAG: hypothetical protein D6805_08420 [Planctomycetota bacterium]|nr:MAG: hypothetical protein D6805_08420 [Planctomycetota bacterium]
MKNWYIFLLCGLFLGILGLWCSRETMEASAPKYLLKLATVAPDGSSWMKIMEKMDEELRQKTQGEVGFQIYGGGRAGEEGAVLEKMRDGEYHAAGFTGLGLGKIYKDTRVLQLPFLYKNYSEYDYVLKKIHRKLWRGIYKNGFIHLGWAEGGFVNLFSKKRLTSLSDIQNSSLWLRQGDPFLKEMFKGLGIVAPVPLGLQDVLPMLQTGKVDTFGVSPLACVALQWHSEVNYCLAYDIYNITAALVISKKVWFRLPKSYRLPLYKTVKKYAKKLVATSRRDNEKAKKDLLKMGIENIQPSSAQVQEMLRKGKEIREYLLKKQIFSAKILNRVQKILEKKRKK